MSEEISVVGADASAPEATVTAVVPEPAPGPEPEAESPPVEPKVDDGLDRYEVLMKNLGEIPDKPSLALLEKIDEKTISSMPLAAKGLLRHLISQQRVTHAAEVEKLSARGGDLDKRASKIDEDHRMLIRNRAQLNQVLLDPKFQELLKAANTPEKDMPDPFTQEGIDARIAKGVAQAMKQFQAPITDAALKAKQMSEYSDFVSGHPQMKDSGFKSDVRKLMQGRKEGGSPISLPDAYAMVDRERLLKSASDQAEKERKARASSARKISRSTMSSSTETGDPVPKWVTKQGYSGSTGQMARIKYLRDNPKALAKLRSSQKGRRRK